MLSEDFGHGSQLKPELLPIPWLHYISGLEATIEWWIPVPLEPVLERRVASSTAELLKAWQVAARCSVAPRRRTF